MGRGGVEELLHGGESHIESSYIRKRRETFTRKKRNKLYARGILYTGEWLHIKGSHKILGADFNVMNSLIRQCIF